MKRAEGCIVDAVNMYESELRKLAKTSKLLMGSKTLEGDSDDFVTSEDERNNDLYNDISSSVCESPDNNFSNDLDDVSVVSQACKMGLYKRLGT